MVGVAGSVNSLSISNAGIGYTPADGSRSVAGVNLVTVTGNGRGAVGTISVQDGVISNAVITNGGSGYHAETEVFAYDPTGFDDGAGNIVYGSGAILKPTINTEYAAAYCADPQLSLIHI